MKTFSKDALNWPQVMVKTFVMLQNIFLFQIKAFWTSNLKKKIIIISFVCVNNYQIFHKNIK